MNDYEKTLYEKAEHDIYAKIPECLSAKELELFLKEFVDCPGNYKTLMLRRGDGIH